MSKGRESLWVLVALVGLLLAITAYVVVHDRAATRHCIDTGHSADECAWR